ncbi:MAG: hypothetical protein JO061_10460, partial [Acidobacteriaceae bacterium]|nr:hypothetical protein [Acidobacteriaceae bacterium]
QRFPGADVTKVKLSDPADLANPVSIEYHVKVEGFATRTGKRLFFTPALFQTNEAARYTGATRKYDLVFHYPWTVIEDVSVSFPDGFALDHPDLPAPVVFEPVGSYSTKALVVGNRVLFHREFTFGKDGSLYFPMVNYPVMKKIFDSVHDNDTHLLSLRQQPAVAEAK